MQPRSFTAREYVYAANARALGVLLALVGFTLCPLTYWLGDANARYGILIGHVLPLSVEQTKLLCFVLSGIFAAGGMLGVILLRGAKRSATRLAVLSDALVVPYGRFVLRERRIPWGLVRGCRLRTFGAQRFLTVEVTSGGNVTIVDTCLPRSSDLDEIKAGIEAKVSHGR